MIDFKPAVRFLKLDKMGEKCGEVGKNIATFVKNHPIETAAGVLGLAWLDTKAVHDIANVARSAYPLVGKIGADALILVSSGYANTVLAKIANSVGAWKRRDDEIIRRVDARLSSNSGPTF